MTHIRIYLDPSCDSCLRHARMHLFFDWFHRVVVSTAAPPGGRVVDGDVVVQELDSGRLLRGARALACICRHIPLYAPARLLLALPPVRRAVDKRIAEHRQRREQARPPQRRR